MTAPVATNRQMPVGTKLKTGFKSLITLAINPSIAFWEVTVQPPGLDGKDPVDTTTMHNVEWRTKAPRTLVEMTNVKTKAAYDPALYTSILAALNVETTITIRFSSGQAIAAYGFLNKFEPDDMSEDKMPEATIEIVITNQDPTTGVETAPVLTTAGGS